MNNRLQSLLCLTLLTTLLSCATRSGTESVDAGTQVSAISGELKQWHRVTLSFAGPETSEKAEDNPFLNYRLQVTFTNGDRTYSVPGYYAADGNAGETSSESGKHSRFASCALEKFMAGGVHIHLIDLRALLLLLLIS